ncbi:hypothetical protein HPB49_003808 [Dermacentor silvarum]|uniref:Uncharacterized protein n=1 Tax=Dermacentor silvarum TaxID=543639 RepID=A0ACB8D2R9_DERSI|nr:hypothetical protein HPB49_003808 [Dermacentor silvarum]
MASQKARLQNTAAGRAILHRTGTATELCALDGQRSLPPEVRSKITANPIPKHMSHELHEGRRKARVDRQRRQFKDDPNVTYVDVAAYPAGGLFAVAAVDGRDNSLTLAASVRAETPAAAETIAAALVIKQHHRVFSLQSSCWKPSPYWNRLVQQWMASSVMVRARIARFGTTLVSLTKWTTLNARFSTLLKKKGGSLSFPMPLICSNAFATDW